MNDVFLTSDPDITDDIMTRYVTFLLSGHSILGIEIMADTVDTYLRVVNTYYKNNNCRQPYDKKSDSDAARLVKDQKKAEKDPPRREPLPDKAMVKMMELAKENSIGFRAAVWDITGLGRLGGFRQQEYAMDTQVVIKTYVHPNGAEVTRAFCVKNIHFRDENKERVENPFGNRDIIEYTGQEYDVQKNRRNGQKVWQKRDRKHVEYCPCVLSIRLVWRAETLGQGRDDPLCVYQDKDGKKKFLIGSEVTKYFRFVVKLVYPNVTAEELKLISTHSIRVTACVLLAEAGKDGWYLKLRLRWLSDCYEIYIRNTNSYCGSTQRRSGRSEQENGRDGYINGPSPRLIRRVWSIGYDYI